ncbi:MAG: lytic transglycosylase domain-containing protein [Nitrospiraceae bacterium]
MAMWNWQLERLGQVFPRTFVAAMVVCVMVLAVPTSTNPDYHGRGPHYSKQQLRRAIKFYAKQYRLDPALLRAVIKAESDFRQDAVSRKGAVGLMQIMPKTAASLQVADPYDSLQNIRAGAHQLRRLLNRYRGNLSLALAAYNAGAQRVKGHQIPRIRETRVYVRKVLRYYHSFRPATHHGIVKPPDSRRPQKRSA